MKRLSITLILCLIIGSISAQTITVNCTVKNGYGKYLRLERKSDYVSNADEVVFADYIPVTNSINFTFSEKETEEYTLYVNFAKSTIYLSPDVIYDIFVTVPESDPTQNPFTNIQYLNVDITSSDIDDINQTISDFNGSYDDFLYANSGSIIRGNHAIHNSFKTSVLNGIKKYHNPFLETYIRYSFALTELSFLSKSKQALADTYIFDNNIEMRNPMYMEFLMEFAKKTGFSPTAKDTKNVELIELVSIINIASQISAGIYSHDYAVAILKKAADAASSPDVRNICNNLLNSEMLLAAGTVFPDIEISDKDGNLVDIQSIDNNAKYLFFYKSCISQNLYALDTLENNTYLHRHHLTLIPIEISDDAESHRKAKFHAVNTYQLHKELNIREYPFVVTIDGQGKVID